VAQNTNDCAKQITLTSNFEEAEAVEYKESPWTIAKLNAASRPPQSIFEESPQSPLRVTLCDTSNAPNSSSCATAAAESQCSAILSKQKLGVNEVIPSKGQYASKLMQSKLSVFKGLNKSVSSPNLDIQADTPVNGPSTTHFTTVRVNRPAIDVSVPISTIPRSPRSIFDDSGKFLSPVTKRGQEPAASPSDNLSHRSHRPLSISCLYSSPIKKACDSNYPSHGRFDGSTSLQRHRDASESLLTFETV
jgi:hypothetical protein